MEAAEVAAAVGKVAERLYAEDEHEGIAEESVAEVMRWLELEIKLAAGAAQLPLPPLPPPPPAPAALYATVGGGTAESCGSSLSGPASTVMASVDGRSSSAATAQPQQAAVPWPWLFPQAAARDEEEEDDAAADEWVSQLLTDGPAVDEVHCGSQ
ncbi:unnamed protein product [Urochloa decumbens]|uniref:Uncharacterized protein n=1 Tax=Urochloa decumbens TaxID=240449 RepID=A0ABC9GN33_9POAL